LKGEFPSILSVLAILSWLLLLLSLYLDRYTNCIVITVFKSWDTIFTCRATQCLCTTTFLFRFEHRIMVYTFWHTIMGHNE
jgi:hypothetical protein